METASLITCLILAAVLLWSAAQKAVPSNPLAATMTRLGFGSKSSLFARFVVLAEAGAALLLLSPRPALGAVAAALLGSAFAVAGGYVLHKRVTVTCACFGGRRGRLGWPQVLAWPAWLVASGLASISPALPWQLAMLLLSLVLIANAAWRLLAVSRAARAARWDRLSRAFY